MDSYEKKYKEALEVAKRKLCFDKAGMVDSFTPNDIYEMFPELRESEDEKIRKELIGFLRNIPNSNYTCEEMALWLEKQGEQKPVDKVEPKFKVGDWIIDVQGVSVNQIIGYEDDSYYIETSCSKFYLPMKLAEKNYRLWTIQDAKAGDVIYSKHNTEDFEWIGIFKSLDEGAHFYGFWNNMTKAFKVCNNEIFVLYDDFSPATKEQCEQLEKAMADAGYAFDFEKKELKKIDSKLNDDSVSNELRAAPFAHAKKEILNHTFPNNEEFELIYTFEEGAKWDAAQKSTWSDEDEVILGEIIDFFENGTVKLQHDLSLYASWLKFLKDRVKTQQEWTMQDEEELQIALDTLIKAGQHSSAKWLKNVCLVPQNKWKPSDEHKSCTTDE